MPDKNYIKQIYHCLRLRILTRFLSWPVFFSCRFETPVFSEPGKQSILAARNDDHPPVFVMLDMGTLHMDLAILRKSDLFGMVSLRDPFKGCWWPPTRGWKGHGGLESPGIQFFFAPWESSFAAEKVGLWQLSLAFLDALSTFTPRRRSIEADVITFTTAIGAFFCAEMFWFCRNSGWIFDFRWVLVDLPWFTCSLWICWELLPSCISNCSKMAFYLSKIVYISLVMQWTNMVGWESVCFSRNPADACIYTHLCWIFQPARLDHWMVN